MNTEHATRRMAQFLGDRTNNTAGQLSHDDWEAVLQAAGYHGVVSLLFRRLTDAGVADSVPPSVLKKMHLQYAVAAIHNKILYDQLAQVLTSLHERGVPVIVLKGAHLAESIYGDVALRPMFDIDLLVRKEDLQPAEAALLEVDYQPSRIYGQPNSWWRQHHFNMHFDKKDKPHLELHWELRKPTMAGLDLDAVWERARPCELGGVNTLVMSPEDLLVYVCLHAALLHRFAMGLRALCDVSQVLSAFRTDFDWNQFLSTVRQDGIASPVHYTLSLTQKVLATPIPAEIMSQTKPDRCDPELLPLLEHYVMTLEQADVLCSVDAMTDVFREDQWWARATALFRAVFPSPGRLRFIYELPPDSNLAWAYYFIRPFDLVRRRSHELLQAARGTAKWKQSLEKARIKAAIDEALDR